MATGCKHLDLVIALQVTSWEVWGMLCPAWETKCPLSMGHIVTARKESSVCVDPARGLWLYHSGSLSPTLSRAAVEWGGLLEWPQGGFLCRVKVKCSISLGIWKQD